MKATGQMRVGMGFLVLAYVLSQFYRAFLAVLAPALQAEIGVGAGDLARASGLWFLAFALMQLPVGWALDRIGPRRTVSVLLAAGAAGALLFGLAEGPRGIDAAMMLIGIGCSAVLMAAYYLFARSFAPALFGTLAGVMVGIGSLGNLASSVPLAYAVEALGWRGTMLALAALTLAVAAGTAVFLRDPPRAEPSTAAGGMLSLLARPTLWTILPIMAVGYGPVIGLRGVWLGPYLGEIYGSDAGAIGQAALLMGLAMVAGSFAYGPLDRLTGTRKGIVLGGTLITAAAFLLLWFYPDAGFWRTTSLAAAIGLFGATYPMIMAHGRAFMPPHLLGRGVTLMNLAAIGGAGLVQVATGWLHTALAPHGAATAYAGLMLCYALLLLAGAAIYAFAPDSTD